MVFYLCEALEKAVADADKGIHPVLNTYQEKAVNLLSAILRGNMDLPIGAVQGPPGTGKTTVVEGFVEHKKGLAEYLVEEASREIIIYTAPTNYLAWDAFRRVSAALLRQGFSLRDIIDLVRVYGSKIRPCRSGYTTDDDRIRKILGKINQLMSKKIDVATVKLVFTVEFQRVSNKFTTVPSRVNFIVDEASKTPYYRFLLPVADAIIRKPGSYPASLMVLGDPEQAITVPEEFRISNIPLLMRYIAKILSEIGHDLEQKHHVLLKVTYRLPRPSEEPISHGYYNGKLRGYYQLSHREDVYKLLDAIASESNKIATKLQEIHGIWDNTTKKLLHALIEAYAQGSPLVVIRTEGFTKGRIPTLDPRRIEIATRIAAIISVALSYTGIDLDYIVSAPYSDLVNTAAYRIRRRLGSKMPKPMTSTVQAMIGNEADIVITMLGKEWGSRGERLMGFDDYETIYSREPEVLNVQLSRHRGLEVIIGDIVRLRRFRQQKISSTAKRIIELKESPTEKIVYIEL